MEYDTHGSAISIKKMKVYLNGHPEYNVEVVVDSTIDTIEVLKKECRLNLAFTNCLSLSFAISYPYLSHSCVILTSF